MAEQRAMPKDDLSAIIPSARGFLTVDDSETPKKSPLTLNTTEVALVFPPDAVELVIVSVSAAVRVSESQGGTTDHYMLLATDTGEVIQMANGGRVYLRADITGAIIQFYFRTI